MKIYFAGSIRGGREDSNIYYEIIIYLRKYGDVLTEHVGYKNLLEQGENSLDDTQIHCRDMKWLDQSDIIIAEVSNPSLGVGYEIGRAIEKNKKIICLYKHQKHKKLSAMISGSENINILEYKDIKMLKILIDSILSK